MQPITKSMIIEPCGIEANYITVAVPSHLRPEHTAMYWTMKPGATVVHT